MQETTNSIPETKVKICGLRRMDDIGYANILLPDYVGFILADGFTRHITAKQAEEFAEKLDSRIKRVGVFVNQPEETVAWYLNSGIIHYAQLHGDEDNGYIEKLRLLIGKKTESSYGIIKAVRVKSAADIGQAAHYNCDYLLLDAYSPKSAGGNGRTFDWTLVKNITKPFFLAGGLSYLNVSDAIESVHPYAVDASSSMETDGYKDFNKMKAFMDAVRGGKYE